jgi:hypothetical protein
MLVGLAVFLASCQGSFGALVTAPNPSSRIEGGGYSGVSTSYFYAPTIFHSDFEVRNRVPLHNHVDWTLKELDPTKWELAVDSNAYSTFIPASSGVDRFGNPIFSPAFYEDSTVSARIPLALTTRLYVQVSLGGAGLRGLGAFDLEYFGRDEHYASDPGGGVILPTTTLAPNTQTDDPLDVVDFSDGFWADAGNYLLRYEMRTTHVDGEPFFDGQVLLTVSFSTVPEPAMTALAGGVIVAAALARRWCATRVVGRGSLWTGRRAGC